MIVQVFAPVSPSWSRPTAVVPVSAVQAFTILTPSRYRSHVLLDPTVPQSSTLCQPVPSLTLELSWVAAKSERTIRNPDAFANTLTMAPPAAVRSRKRSTEPVPKEVAFMFMLAHTDGYESAKSSFAKAAAPTGFPSALGIVGNPCVESTVRPVTLVQLDRSPDV